MNVFERAEKAYLDTAEFLEKAVFPFRKEYEEKEGNDDYSVEAGLNSFDLLIQYSMFQLSLVDEKLDENELAYMKDMCKYSSFPSFLEYLGYEDVTWEKLFEMDTESLSALLTRVRNEVVSITQDFVESFAMYDFFDEKVDYTKTLANCINDICVGLLVSDGEALDEELSTSCLALDALEAIQKIIRDNKQRGREREEAPTLKSPDTSGLEHPTPRKKREELKDVYKAGVTDCGGNGEPVYYENKELATVYVDANHGTGSGFIINKDGLCFTCNHVVEGEKEVYVRIELKDGTRVSKKADVIATDKDDDYALLQIKEVENTNFFELEETYKDIKAGDPVAIFGFPFGQALNPDPIELEPGLTQGYVASKNKPKGKVIYYLDCRSFPGNSGGPVFHLKTGKVMGYLCGAYGPANANLDYCRSLTYFYIEQSFKK